MQVFQFPSNWNSNEILQKTLNYYNIQLSTATFPRHKTFHCEVNTRNKLSLLPILKIIVTVCTWPTNSSLVKIFKRHFRKQKLQQYKSTVSCFRFIPNFNFQPRLFCVREIKLFVCSFLAFFFAFFLVFFGFKKKIFKVIDDDKLFFINYSHSSFDFFVCWIARETENNILKMTAHTIRERKRKIKVMQSEMWAGEGRKGHDTWKLHAFMIQVSSFLSISWDGERKKRMGCNR